MSSSSAASVHVRAALLAWFDAHARDLPWRRTDDAYAVWVSEVMLQQTRVDTVVPYYRAWLRRFPDVDALASAGEDEVLRAWEGLGYYRRARALHRAAVLVRDRHGGALPSTAEGLRALPGVGEYTAGAVASIAFGEAVPAVDGNVRRVLARLHDESDPTPAWLRDAAAALVSPERPGDLNQALMELGATVCVPRDPSCGACPVASACAARSAGTVEERPAPRRRAAVPTRRFGVGVVVDARCRALLARRPPDGLLGGLWEFPSDELVRGEAPSQGARRAVADHGVKVDPEDARPVAAVRHAFSHFTAVYEPVLLRAEGGGGVGEPADPGPDAVWRPLHDLGALALPVAQRKVAARALAALRDAEPPDG